MVSSKQNHKTVSLTFAHLSDPHLQIQHPPTHRQLWSKRILGWSNWKRNRRHHHRPEILNAITNDISNQSPDMIALTGDVVNIGLASEFIQAVNWIQSLGKPEKVMFVPGNHDTYVRADWDETLGRLAPFMQGRRVHGHGGNVPKEGALSGERPASGFDDFPYLRKIGSVNFIGLNSSPSTLPGLATGAIGEQQIERLESILDIIAQENEVSAQAVIVMLHHPAQVGVVQRRKALDDASALSKCLANAGVDLVLHGHAHYPCFSKIIGSNGGIPHIGVASASYAGKGENPDANGYRPAAQYHLYTIKIEGDRVSILLEVRGVDLDTGEVKKIKSIALPEDLDGLNLIAAA